MPLRGNAVHSSVVRGGAMLLALPAVLAAGTSNGKSATIAQPWGFAPSGPMFPKCELFTEPGHQCLN